MLTYFMERGRGGCTVVRGSIFATREVLNLIARYQFLSWVMWGKLFYHCKFIFLSFARQSAKCFTEVS